MRGQAHAFSSRHKTHRAGGGRLGGGEAHYASSRCSKTEKGGSQAGGAGFKISGNLTVTWSNAVKPSTPNPKLNMCSGIFFLVQ